MEYREQRLKTGRLKDQGLGTPRASTRKLDPGHKESEEDKVAKRRNEGVMGQECSISFNFDNVI